MSPKFPTYQSLFLACITAIFPSNAFAQQNSIEEFFVDAECQVKKGMHASHDFTKNEMFSGGINGGYIGSTSLKVGFKHTENDEGGVSTSVSYTWTKSPVDGERLRETYPEGYFNPFVALFEDYFSFVSHSQNVSLRRTYKNDWHGILVDLGGSDERRSAFVYPLKCKFNNSINGPLDLIIFRYDKIFEKLGLKSKQ